MGFLDWIRGRKSRDDVAEFLNDEGPRRHHYALAHLALRQIALGSPLAYLGSVVGEGRSEFFKFAFNAVCEEEQKAGRTAAPDFGAEDLKGHQGWVGEFPCAIVEMPTPKRIVEAYYTGLVVTLDPLRLKEALTDKSRPIPARYFTLEAGVSDDGTPRTVFCEWRESMHANFGDGPEPTVANFARRIKAALGKGASGSDA